ncbi:MAG TPA: MarR family transcriptional regulator [Ktedonobacterales bacterium]|jgi:DNA-binding MarR family transcriptional regulator
MPQSPVTLWVRFARVFHRMDRRLVAQLRARDLSLAQFDVLAQVSASEGLTQQELADRLLVTKGNVCQLLDRMEDADLLTRRQDGRANRVYLTASGARLVQEVLPEHEALISSLLSALTPDEQRQLRVLLRTLDHNLRGDEGEV